MADPMLLRSPFGVLYAGTRPVSSTRVNHKNRWGKSLARTASRSLKSIYLLDPPPAILRMLEQVCPTESSTRYYLTCWQAPGDIRHTKISFLVDTPEEALRLLQTTAQAWEQQGAPVRR